MVASDFVEREAMTRLAALSPGVDVDAWPVLFASERDRSPTSTVPLLSGRVVEALLNLAVADLARGRAARAESLVRLVRARAANRNAAFVATLLLAEATRQLHGADDDVALVAVTDVFREVPLARLGSAAVGFQLFRTQQQLAAEVEALSEQPNVLETASEALFFAHILPRVLAHRELFSLALARARVEAETLPPEVLHDFADVSLGHLLTTDVVVAVWDQGTATSLFSGHLFSNPDEVLDGQDNEQNGLVDDVHGIVDMEQPHTALLYEPAPAVLQSSRPFLKGLMDLRAGLASTPEAERVLELNRSVTDTASVMALEHNLNALAEWAQGTHVASLLVAGNPRAKLVVFRSAWAGQTRLYFHRGPTDDELAAERRNVDAIARFIRTHRIRVVNASFVFSLDYLESQLRYQPQLYPTQAAIAARALQIQAKRRQAWQSVITTCPDTLFVVPAGNSSRDVLEYQDIPAALQHPNLITVGAVDKYGRWAHFTNSNAKIVRIYDFGVDVPGLIPTGETLPLSGTSMGSPNVANLAGKLLAVNPLLAPTDVIALIEQTADPVAAPYAGAIPNEVKAIAAARALRSSRGGRR